MTEIKDSESLTGWRKRAKRTIDNWYSDANLSQYLLLFAVIAVVLVVILSRGERFPSLIREAFRAVLDGF